MFSPPAFLMDAPLLRRIVPSVLRRYAKIFKHRYVIEERMGGLFLIDQRNSVDRNLLIKGAWEPQQVETLKDMIRKSRRAGESVTFLDIGAHGALYSIILAKEKLADRIVAFEPDPTNLVQLRANLFINHMLERIEVIDKAASDSKARIPFFVAKESNRGGSRMTEKEPEILDHRIEVESEPLDDMVQIEGNLVVAKIDVEGSELTVLKGMTKTIAANRCLFQIESFDDTVNELKAWMSEHGFVHQKTVDFDHFFVKD
jgi:FkbM family methyltransferase